MLKTTAVRKSKQTYPEDKYWIRPHQRKRIDKNGKTYIEHVKGYWCSYHGPFHKMAVEKDVN